MSDEKNINSEEISNTPKKVIKKKVIVRAKKPKSDNDDKMFDIDLSSYEYQISTGNLVVIILESDDGEHLSGFIMDGNGELLFNSLLELIGDNFEKTNNTLEDMIEELRRFKPYGTF